MKQINNFYESLSRLDAQLSKKKKYIRDSGIKSNVIELYVEWKKYIKPKVEYLQIEDSSQQELNSAFEGIYKLARKDFFNKSQSRKYLKSILKILFDKVLIVAKTKEQDYIAISTTLYEYIDKVATTEEKSFLEDAVTCLSIEKRKPAIIMSWVLVMYRLYSLIQKNGFDGFNKAYGLRYGNANPKFKKVKKLDDFEYFPDQETIFIAEDLGIIDRNQRRILLDDCLRLRNMCSHPGKYDPGAKSTEVYFEKIIDTILSR